ncbi:probable ubiquitin-conjugating enzyme E2 W-B [Folsomia candida]|uniref:probable ubiquitin-conjugating enzyme E2 W-B n=1 Tax=Folsomia candida TaxID=158441 RepID=UPI000B8FBCAC|nr:probable ubiquitin-conjugating enzyme E2 W-B [Folsomia candida]
MATNSPLTPSQRRLQKELMSMLKDAPPGITVDTEFIASKNTGSSNCIFWRLQITGPTPSLYANEEFTLSFKFSQKYPFESPEVIFTGDNIPVHPHIYSNGHICLSILTDDWSPALSVQSVCLSIVSMLGSAVEKKHPPDDAFYVKTCSKNPKKTRWWYHDDNV